MKAQQANKAAIFWANFLRKTYIGQDGGSLETSELATKFKLTAPKLTEESINKFQVDLT
jgi:hypothetical protein